MLLAFPKCVVLVGVLIAARTDLWNFRIYDVLTIPFILSGLLYHTFFGQAVGLSVGVWGVLVATAPFSILYLKGGMGAGDLKLMASVGAWLGPWFTLHVIIVSCFATMFYSAGLLILNRLRSETGPCGTNADRTNSDDIVVGLNRPNRRERAVPFGAMVALGVIVAQLWLG